MTGFTLTLKSAPALRLDVRGVTPNAFASLSAAEVERLPLAHGNAFVPLAEFFTVAPRRDDTLLLQGDLSRCDFVGWQMNGGTLIAEGSVGDYAGGAMSAGTLTVKGHAADLAACEMAGGTLDIAGHVGDFAAGTLPGSMDGMRGGSLLVRGNAGARFGDRMRRGTALIFGDAGEFLASRMVAGTIAIAGRAGAHVGYGMRRGSVVFAGPAPGLAPTFVPAGAGAPVFWQLLARDLARHGGAFGSLAARGFERHLGDVAAAGKGELIVVR
ncbi:formylmethanofuran dehydrogenase subunit C [Piscinibacter sp.]|uniref:formylmethanofuran dehydrogenase subunit C n=1 Tax=Piscinibacter sp. TaxID=1903157 RepID=UPI0039E2757F